nr:MAG TPA: hypothetical protein [Bacteriophage sp.]
MVLTFLQRMSYNLKLFSFSTGVVERLLPIFCANEII